MATIPTQSLTEPFHPYPDSADNTAPGATADAGEFFSTLLDIINPLQHIPLVSKLYREWTGDEINSTARMVGGGGRFLGGLSVSRPRQPMSYWNRRPGMTFWATPWRFCRMTPSLPERTWPIQTSSRRDPRKKCPYLEQHRHLHPLRHPVSAILCGAGRASVRARPNPK